MATPPQSMCTLNQTTRPTSHDGTSIPGMVRRTHVCKHAGARVEQLVRPSYVPAWSSGEVALVALPCVHSDTQRLPKLPVVRDTKRVRTWHNAPCSTCGRWTSDKPLVDRPDDAAPDVVLSTYVRQRFRCDVSVRAWYR